LRKAFRQMSEAETLAYLARAPMNKVTVAKEVVRLLGEMRSDEAYRQLMGFDRPELHRDVRVALLRALFDHLERPPTWSVLERAVADPDWILAGKLAEVPLARLSAENEERVGKLLAAVLARREPEARLALLARVPSLPLRDDGRLLFRACLELLGASRPEECEAACSAVLQRMRPGEVDVVLQRMRELIPRRRTLSAWLARVPAHAHSYAGAHLHNVARGLLVALSHDPLAVRLQLELAARVLQWRDLASTFVDISKRGLLHADAMTAAKAAVDACAHPELLEQHLTDQPDPNLRRLALAALLSAAGPGRGWTSERRERLERYRRDTAPLVAAAASFVFPPE
jgi:hypothetical protein